VCLTYSAGLPIMYIIGTFYFFITYWFDKISLMRYYQKTKVFNEELPIESVKMFKYAIMLHFLFAGVMYSSSRILISEEIDTHHYDDVDLTKEYIEKVKTPHVLILLLFVGITLVLYVYSRIWANPVAVVLKEYMMFVKDANDQDKNLGLWKLWKNYREHKK